MTASPPHNLPARRKRFIGRVDELANLDTLSKQHPLVTIVGTGGMGKTRLAMHFGAVVERYDRVVLCKVATARTLESFIDAVAQPLGWSAEDADNLGGGRLNGVGEALAQTGRSLVMLDNLEQAVAPAAHAVSRWMDLAPDVTFIATSRQALHLRGEALLRLESLDVDEAIALFEHRAHQLRPEFRVDASNRQTIAAIVDHLDHVPLAVELAAARINVFAAADIRQRLTQPGGGLDTLIRKTRHATVRHQSMHATLYWSWELLDDHERRVLAEASIFCGGFDLQAAQAVLTAPDSEWVGDILEALVDKSLVVAQRDADRPARSARRFRLLETTREFGQMMLADGQRPSVEKRHARYYAQRLADLDQLGRRDDLANIEQAFWSSVDRDPNLAAQLAVGAYQLAQRQVAPSQAAQNQADSSVDWPSIVDAALKADPDDPGLRVQLRRARARHSISGGCYRDAVADLDVALAHAGDDAGVRTQLLFDKVSALRRLGAPAAAGELIDQATALVDATADARAAAKAAETAAMVDFELACFDRARDRLGRTLQSVRSHQFDRLEAKILVDLSLCEIPIGELQSAESHLQEADIIGCSGLSHQLRWFEAAGWLHWYRGRRERAADTFANALAVVADHPGQGASVERHVNAIRFGLSAVVQPDDDTPDSDTPPAEHLRAILETAWTTEDVWTRVQARTRMAIRHLGRGQFRDAVWILRQATDEVDRLEAHEIRAHVRCWAAIAEAAVGRQSRAEDLLERARKLFDDDERGALKDDIPYFLRVGKYLADDLADADAAAIIDDLQDQAKQRRFRPEKRIWRWICYDHLLALAGLIADHEAARQSGGGDAAGGDTAAGDTASALAVADDGRRVELPGGQTIDLSSRKALGLIMAELARRRRDGDRRGIAVDDLRKVGWPGETLTKSAGSSRVYTAIRTLRSMGLDGILLTGRDGYLLDPDIPFELI